MSGQPVSSKPPTQADPASPDSPTDSAQQPRSIHSMSLFESAHCRLPWFVSGLMLFIGSSAPPQSAAVEAVLRQHIDWRGGRDALVRLQDVSWSGTIAAAGLEGTIALRETRLGWWRRETHLGSITRVEVVGPEGAWITNFAGQLEPMAAGDADDQVHANARSFARHLLDEDTASVQDLGFEERDGQRWRVLRFSYPNQDYVDLFLDPQDASCTWTRERHDTLVLWTRLTDWRTVAGVRVPFEERTFHDDPNRDATIRWTTVEANRNLSASAFGRPMARATVAEIAGGLRSTPWIDVELSEGHYIILQGEVNGHGVPILLDSGAAVTLLSTTFAAQTGIRTAGVLPVVGTTSTQQASLASDVDIAIGPARFSSLTVVVTDLRSVEEAMGRRVPVILGKEAFNAFVIEVDYPKSKIAFHQPRRYQPDASARSLRVLPGGSGMSLVEARVEGLPPASFVLDTGSGGTVTFYKAYVEEHRLLQNRMPRSQRWTRGVGGGAPETVATLRTFEIAGFQFSDMPADFYQEEKGAFNTRRAAGNLGAGVLNRFRVAFDYGRNVMYLMPGSGWNTKPFPRNHAGIQADYRGSFLEVIFVAPGSPAAQAGWTVGDRIIAVDRKPISPDYASDANPWWSWKPGTVVTLTDGTGVERKLTLAVYY